MLTVTLEAALDPGAAALAPICLGTNRPAETVPRRFAIVRQRAEPVLRIDLYATPPDCFAFEEAGLWGDWVVVGHGSRLHFVSLVDRSTRTHELDAYFGALWLGDGLLLVTSGERVFRYAADGELSWQSDVLAVDGVVLHEVTAQTIRGEGDWDPPGGWRPFELATGTGLTVPASRPPG